MIEVAEKEGRIAKTHFDRRRSHRVQLAPGLAVQIDDLGPARLTVISLGGATLETERKPRPRVRYPLLLEYRGAYAPVEIEIYDSIVKELFYSDGVGSKVRYRSRGRFCDPPVEALNLVYRIMRENWRPTDE